MELHVEASDWIAQLLRHALRDCPWPSLEARFSNPPEQDWVSLGLTPPSTYDDVTVSALVFVSGVGDGLYQSLTLHKITGAARERSDTQLGPSTKLSRHPAVAAGQALARLDVALRSASQSWGEAEEVSD